MGEGVGCARRRFSERMGWRMGAGTVDETEAGPLQARRLFVGWNQKCSSVFGLLHARPCTAAPRKTPRACGTGQKYLFFRGFRHVPNNNNSPSPLRLICERERERRAWLKKSSQLGLRSWGSSRSNPRTVPRNQELMTPGQVRPLSSTLMPSTNTAVLATRAEASPGLGDYGKGTNNNSKIDSGYNPNHIV